MNANPMEVFQKEAPEVAAAFNGLIQSLVATKGLDQKTKQTALYCHEGVGGG